MADIDSIDWHQRVVELEAQLAAAQQQVADLREHAEQYQLFMENAGEILYVFNLATGHADFVSPAVERLTGYTVAEALTHSMDQVMTAESYAFFKPLDDDRLRRFLNGEPAPHIYVDELVHNRKNGSTYPSELVSSYTTNRRGQPITVGILRDITARKQAEAALRHSEARWHTIVNTSPDGICIASPAGEIQFVSDKLLAMHGYERPADMLGRSVFEFLDADYHALAAARLHQLLNGQYTGVSEYRLIKRDGSRFYMDINAEVLRDEAGQPIGVLYLERDVTLRRQAEENLAALNRDLETRVAERTSEYLETIQQLEAEIVIRQAVEQQLRQLQANLVERVTAQGHKLTVLYETLLVHDIQAEANLVVAQVLKKVIDLMKAEAACLHEPQADGLVLIASEGLSETEQLMLRSVPDGWLDEGVALASTAVPQDGRLPQQVRQLNYHACLAIMVRRTAAEVLHVFWRGPHTLMVDDIALFTVIAEQIGIILENARLRQRLEQKAVLDERQRLARDLHDSVTQSLHGLTLYVSALQNRLRLGQSAKVIETLNDLDQTARQALKEMRLMLYEMRLEPPEAVPLAEALQTRLDSVERRAGIDAVLAVSEPPHWPSAWEAALYPIAMEALNNSLKHAAASQVRVQLHGGPTWAELSIDDNGRGFQPSFLPRAGLGLQSMRERAQRLGGTLQIDSQPGAGTRVRLRIGRPE